MTTRAMQGLPSPQPPAPSPLREAFNDFVGQTFFSSSSPR